MSEKYEPMKLEDYMIDNYEVTESGEFDPETTDEVSTETTDEVAEPTTDVEETQSVSEQEQDQEQAVEEQPTQEQITQTPEQNARFAEQRRQKQIEERVQQELERVRQQAPEFQMAQMLSDMYGMPVDQLYDQLREAALQKQAEERGLPVEVMKQLSEYEQQQKKLQEQLSLMQFQNWQNKVTAEAQQIINDYPMLTQDDIEQAQFYLLETLQNPEIPLQQAIFALHGGKITDSFKNLAKQEAMAEISGRKKGGLPPQSMKTTSEDNHLSAEERYVAKMMGMNEADYLKWKS